MIIGIDANEANQKIRVGVGQYAYNLLSALYRLDTSNQYFLYLKEKPLADMPKARKNWQYLVIGPRPLWTKIALPLHLFFDFRHLDLFYSPGHYLPMFSPFSTVPTIHDIGYLQYREQFTKKDLYQLIHWTEASLKQSKNVICVSEFTKKELINTYQLSPQNIFTIYNGVSPAPKISPLDAQKVLQKFNINSPYFLAVGTLKPNKNYPFLIETFNKFLLKHPNYQLVIAGKKGWLFAEIDTLIQKLNISAEKLIFTDYISESEKWALYQKATSLIIPSTYEGFGIPAIESQQAGTPVLSSHIAPLKEVLADTAIYFDPQKSSTLLTAMEKIISLKDKTSLISQGKKQAAKFTWENSAKKLLNLFQQLSSVKNV